MRLSLTGSRKAENGHRLRISGFPPPPALNPIEEEALLIFNVTIQQCACAILNLMLEA